MNYLEIVGGTKLSGKVQISGSKNSALPIIAATILSDTPVLINNVPDISDIRNLLTLLESLGSKNKFQNNCLWIDNSEVTNTAAILMKVLEICEDLF